MNKLERAYGQYLNSRVWLHEIQRVEFEAVKLRIGELGKRCWYTPDFAVWDNEGRMEFHETKGAYTWEDARVKLLAAARIYTHATFYLVKRDPSTGGWDITKVSADRNELVGV